jgi:nitrogen fixation protein NifU and related proteins
MMLILNYEAAIYSVGGISERACRLPHYNRSVYSAELLDHFQNPRNPGEVEAPDSCARSQNPVCGDILELTLKLDGSRVCDIRFRAKGCVPAMACGSAITELIKGKNVEEARRVSREELLRKVGGLPQASTHASHLAMDALATLLRGL